MADRYGGKKHHTALESNPLLNIFPQHLVIYKPILRNKKKKPPPSSKTQTGKLFFFLIQQKPIGKSLTNCRKAAFNNLKPWRNSLVSHRDHKNILGNPTQHFHHSDISTVGSSLQGAMEETCTSALSHGIKYTCMRSGSRNCDIPFPLLLGESLYL